MKDGFIRVAAATPKVKVADCAFNTEKIILCIKEAENKGASLIVFPELCITGYTCADLFLHKQLIDSAEQALNLICAETKDLDIVSVVGLPVRGGNSLYNCAAVIKGGQILALVPKINIPAYNEFHEMRYFSEGNCNETETYLCSNKVKICSNVIFACKSVPEFTFGVEICEDLWVSDSPTVRIAGSGANIIANLSASNDAVGKAEYRRNLVLMQSAKLISAYIYADCGFGESTTDMVFSGQNMICENGTMLREAQRFKNGIIYADVDLQKIEGERRKMNTFSRFNTCNVIEFDIKARQIELNRSFAKLPFVPQSKKELDKRCDEIICIQATGLATRLEHTGIKNAVIGLSGGLDSTLALVATIRAFDMLNLPRENILTVTMPCFGTTSRTKSNAQKLSAAYGTAFRQIDITRSVKSHFADISQKEDDFDVTFENAQARERTQVLMDLANKNGGLVVGTGDLSELALGWATYNGDHMSMYAINCSVPKTLVKYIVKYEAERSGAELKDILLSVLDTPVSPELLPPENGEISQKTEELVGPYELHDFFLYYFVRFGFTPMKILRLAMIAFENEYDEAEIRKWLRVFVRRFFSQQFKRSCLPDGPKVGSVTLSPRSDLRMPSDASASEWLKEI